MEMRPLVNNSSHLAQCLKGSSTLSFLSFSGGIALRRVAGPRLAHRSVGEGHGACLLFSRGKDSRRVLRHGVSGPHAAARVASGGAARLFSERPQQFSPPSSVPGVQRLRTLVHTGCRLSFPGLAMSLRWCPPVVWTCISWSQCTVRIF